MITYEAIAAFSQLGMLIVSIVKLVIALFRDKKK